MLFEIHDKKKREMFIYIFNHLKHFTDKIKLNVDEDKMYIQGMDNSHICVYELTIQSSWFDKWDVKEANNYGIHIPMFNKILNICSDKQIIRIHSETEDSLHIEYHSEEKGEFNKFLEMPLLDLDIDMLHIPDTDYQVDIEMDSKKFKSIIDELSNFNETLNIVCDETELVLESNSCEGNMKVVINMDDIELLAVEEGKRIEASFGIKYIAQMCQFYKLSSDCAIYITEDIPLLLKYEMADDCIMKFYLAPKIKDD
jgi:proliferating cell nuclear antigen|tara:strand:- start:742 stop:1509 length:768 start_codon:yes stop_codon:yes gene_type:complete